MTKSKEQAHQTNGQQLSSELVQACSYVEIGGLDLVIFNRQGLKVLFLWKYFPIIRI